MPKAWPDHVWSGRKVGSLTLQGIERTKDGERRVRAVCDCGRTTLVRPNHVAPGVTRMTESCGRDCALAHPPQTDYAGASLGDGARVFAGGLAPEVQVMCPAGHIWTHARGAAANKLSRLRRGLAGATGRVTVLECPECRVHLTVDLRGQVFGLLTVLSREGTDAPDGRWKGQATWRCRCECGNEKVVRGAHLRRGAVKTCGARECTNYVRTGN